jgi:hypothetical protein
MFLYHGGLFSNTGKCLCLVITIKRNTNLIRDFIRGWILTLNLITTHWYNGMLNYLPIDDENYIPLIFWQVKKGAPFQRYLLLCIPSSPPFTPEIYHLILVKLKIWDPKWLHASCSISFEISGSTIAHSDRKMSQIFISKSGPNEAHVWLHA